MQDKIAELKIIRKRVDELIPHELNPRFHPNSQVDKIVEWLSKVGYYKSIVVQKDTNKILAGHGVLQGLIADGYTHVDVSEVDQPDKWAMALLAWDNKSGELSSWEQVNLIALQAELGEMDVQMEEMGFDAGEIDSMGSNAVTEEDEPPPVSEEEPITQTGDLWICGDHRVLCGDSTKAADVERVMDGEKADMVFTDPPYNVQIDYDTYKDNLATEEWEAFTLSWYKICRELSMQVLFTPGTGRGLGHPNFQLWYKIAPPDWIICWVKKNSVVHSSLGGFNNWEPIFFYGKPKKKIAQDIYDIPITVQTEVADENGNKLHPTPKQVKLWAAVIEDFTDSYDIVYDCFLGSGTTLIAADQLNRKCYGIEIAPKYCDVIVKRYINHAGSSEDVHVERDGKKKTWDELRSRRNIRD